MVGNGVVYPHPIGGTRDAGDGSCCAGCQERCCQATTHRGGDVRRLASDGEEVGRSWQLKLAVGSVVYHPHLHTPARWGVALLLDYNVVEGADAALPHFTMERGIQCEQ